MTRRIDHATGLTAGRFTRNDSGALASTVRFARAGNVQAYGSTRAYRPDSEVFAPEAMASFEGVGITIGHPQGFLDAHNWEDLVVGYLRNVRRDGEYVAGDVIVLDEKSIGNVLDGGLVELSAGYSTRDEKRGGVSPRGEVFDEVMRDIRGNHVALLPEGLARAGRGARIVG